MKLQFANAWMLTLLWLVPLMAAGWAWLDERHHKAMDRLVVSHLRRTLAPPSLQTRQMWQLICVTAGIALLLVAGARPQWGEREQIVHTRGRDVVLAVDVSRSMLAPDVHPNRLGRAKADLIDLIRDLRGDRAAVLAFRRSPRVVCPFTTDYAFLKQAIDGLAPYSAPRGETDIGAAITKALEILGEGSAHKAIVLVSDGEDLSGKGVEAAKEAAARGIPIYAIGLGSRSGSRIPDAESQSGYARDGEKDAISRLDDSTLNAIASASANGAYIPLGIAGTASTTLGQIYRERLHSIEARDIAEAQRRRVVERFQWFLAPAILLLFAAAFMSRGRLAIGRKRTLQRATTISAMLCLMAFGAPAAHAQEATNQPAEATEPAAPQASGPEAAWRAQKLARAGDHAAAAVAFERAAQGAAPKQARTFMHNAAAAYYRAGDLQKASDSLRSLTAVNATDRGDDTRALGAVQYELANQLSVTNAATAAERTAALCEAGEHFREAARMRSDTPEARNDLAAAYQQWQQAATKADAMDIDERYGQMKPTQLADMLFTQQRQIREAAAAQATNTTPERVKELEALGAEQRELVRAWGPLQEKLAQAMAKDGAVTNAQQAAAINQFIQEARGLAQSAASKLRDLSPDATGTAQQGEEATYQIWKSVAPFEKLIGEGVYRQTNAASATAEAVAGHSIDYPRTVYNQREAADLTRSFRERFEKAIPEEGNLTTVTNSVDGVPTVTTNGISAEARAEIMSLSDLLGETQQRSAKKLLQHDYAGAAKDQQESMDAATRIVELLPKPPPQPQQQQDKQQQKKKQDQNDQKNPQKSDDQKQPQQQPQDQPQQQDKQDQKKNEQQAAKKRQEQDAETLLERALEREREYKEMKQKRERNIPMLPGQRDL